ncbi:winged helix-turn-helix transcriptional regulator [Saccharothrix syringae]|uniref:winged helix-turn-helix transcriptional regulator n=1 Tax=Saccharothrix syringae TaxID=103733 RepID=UPI00200BF363|nr:helix-turn-helix domain-containing protein [Saccharothrix syringae]
MEERISSVNCSVARALAVVGERWTLLIVREAFDGVRRFQDFRTRLGIASNLLTARLETLVEAEVMTRVPYREKGDRLRYEYHLTERGADLRPVLIALLQWGDRYLADPEGPSVVPRHAGGPDGGCCDEPVRVVVECAAGHGPLRAEDVRRTPGPGARFVG